MSARRARRAQLRDAYLLVAQSGLFDRLFYLDQNPDVAQSRVDPLRHYLELGGLEGRDPHPLFDSSWYIQHNSDVAAAKVNPLVHYVMHGWHELRPPHPLFDPLFYTQQNPALAGSQIDPLRHYIELGRERNPHILFDSRWYLQQSPDVAQAGVNPLVHYLSRGWKEGRDPHPLFETSFYLEQNSDVAVQGGNPLLHFVTRGAAEGRNPHPLFDSSYYRRTYSGSISGDTNPLIDYLLSANDELRSPHPLFDPSFYRQTHPDVRSVGMKLLIHYVTAGAAQLFSPHPLFDVPYYLEQKPELPARYKDPLRHYVCTGAQQGLDPCDLFDSDFYVKQYPEVARAKTNPLVHYLTEGAVKGYNPNPLFETAFYLEQNPDVALSGTNPLVHFVLHGAAEGRMPNPLFDPRFYLKKNPDVQRSGTNPLAHYLVRGGAGEGRDPGPLFSTSRYLSKHPDLKQSGMNPLAHLLNSRKKQRPDEYKSTDTQKDVCIDVPNVDLLTDLTNIEGNPIQAANRALKATADACRHLLVLLAPVAPSNEAVSSLTEGFNLDPHFGIIIPRQSTSAGGDIRKLDETLGDPEVLGLPQSALRQVPDFYIFPELLSPCFLIRDVLVSNLGQLDESFESLAGGFLDYLIRARRRGFRCVVLNNTVVPAGDCSLADTDLVYLARKYPDLARAKLEFDNHPAHLHESLLARALPANRQSLLIDARGLSEQVNGTSEAILGLCDGLQSVSRDWEINILVSPGAAQFHNIANLYAAWPVFTEPPKRCFTAALMPSQPWHLSSVIDLHRLALFNFYTILDTIAWDIFPGHRELDLTWDFVSAHADGILYNSQYTRRHFATRFPLAQATPAHVSYHSFDPEDYRIIDVPPDDGSLFIVGNNFDHKHVTVTADLLASAFPAHRIKAVGLKSHPSPLVEAISSGQIPQFEIDRLYTQAKIVVFPSLYEGFGFPVLRGLSNGRTVVARHSELLTEIAARYRGPGRLIAFRNETELVEAVDCALKDVDAVGMPLGGALSNGEKPAGWTEIANGVLRFIENQIRDVRRARWRDRERGVRQLTVSVGPTTG